MRQIQPLVRSVGWALSAFLLLIGTGCSQPEPPVNTVLTVGQTQISDQELLALAQARGLDGTATQLNQLAQQLAQQLAAEQQLVANGWDQPTDYLEAKRRFIQTYVKAQIQQQLESENAVSDDEVAAYFTANRAQYSQPEQVRVALIEIARQDHEQAEQLAQRIQDELKAESDTAKRQQLFNRYAATYSAHTSSRYRGGDVGYIEPNDKHWPQALAKAALASQADESTSDLIATNDSLFIFKVIARKAPVEPVLDDYTNSIRSRLLTQKRQQVQQLAQQRLMAGIKIETNEGLIQTIAKPKKPALPPEPTGLPVNTHMAGTE